MTIIVKILGRRNPKVPGLIVKTAKIFDDCIICDGKREKSKAARVFVMENYEDLNIVRCNCPRPSTHRELEEEAALIEILQQEKIEI